MTQQEESIHILEEVIQELTSSSHDLKSIMRKCQHVCEILGWEPQKLWFHQEINGYYANTTLPSYRKIPGRLVWEPLDSVADRVYWESALKLGEVSKKEIAVQETVLDIISGLDWINKAAEFGYNNPTGETKNVIIRSREFPLQRIETSKRFSFSQLIIRIEQQTFDFASRAYVQQRYGNAIGDIWVSYRGSVESELSELGMNQHLNVIESGLLTNNSESWRTAVFECRNLLNDLANHLWRDQRPTYVYLPGQGSDGLLDVTQGKFGNRLAAYIHQKGISGTRGSYLRDEAERLAASIKSLIALQSEAHEPVRLVDAQSVAIRTYFAVGEIIRRTDMQPILEYVNPVIPNER